MSTSSSLDAYDYDLGNFNRPITTSSHLSQKWFDRGLVWCWGYNHEEAVRCFTKSAEHDDRCVMAYWGIAFASGINYNNFDSLDVSMCEVAYNNSRKAASLIEQGVTVSDVEKELVNALLFRYSPSMPDNSLLPHQIAFSNAMRTVYQKFPADVNVAAIFAESLMNINPWKLWTKDGKPVPGTLEIVDVLEHAISNFPKHPGIYHLYIHTIELSLSPIKALAVADSLGELVPDSGHLQHMPSHIYISLGLYQKCIDVNLKGIEVDNKFLSREGANNFYTMYRLHNYHFVVYGAMFNGQYQLAIDTAKQLVEQISFELLQNLVDWLETMLSIPLHVLIRFGKWHEILNYPVPPSPPPSGPSNYYAVSHAFYHYARSIAFASLRDIPSAEFEKEKFLQSSQLVPSSRRLFNNTATSLLEIAKTMIFGEIAYRARNFSVAFEYLLQGIELDDNLPYEEPWGWMQPVRHAAGALLLEQGRVEEAEVIYKKDLDLHPNNCWALHGLEECFRRLGRTKEAEELKRKLETVEQKVDVTLKASCFCRLEVFEE